MAFGVTSSLLKIGSLPLSPHVTFWGYPLPSLPPWDDVIYGWSLKRNQPLKRFRKFISRKRKLLVDEKIFLHATKKTHPCFAVWKDMSLHCGLYNSHISLFHTLYATTYDFLCLSLYFTVVYFPSILAVYEAKQDFKPKIN